MSTPASILLVGLGGAGCSMVMRLSAQLPPEVAVALLDTDARSLSAGTAAAISVLGLTNANQPAPTNPIETDRVCPSPTESDQAQPSLTEPNRV